MPDFGQPAVLERAVFWLRLVGILLTSFGIMAIAVANYFSTRVASARMAEMTTLRDHVRVLESRMDSTRRQPPAVRPQRYLTVEQHRSLAASLAEVEGMNVAVVSALEWEAGNYAHQLIKSLRIAGLNVRVTYAHAEQTAPGLLLIHNGGNGGQWLAAALRQVDSAVVERTEKPRFGAAAELHVGPMAQSPAATSAPASDAVK